MIPTSRPLGIVAALHAEIAGLLEAMQARHVQRIGGRDYHRGMLDGRACVVVLARVGKVAAAATVVTLIHTFDVEAIVFTGVAGGIGPGVAIGDIVIGDVFMQHDMDASPLFPRHEIPLLALSRLPATPDLSDRMTACAGAFLTHDMPTAITADDRSVFALRAPRVHRGLIVSGDCFVSGATHAAEILAALPDALCVEMEGGAVAQVCVEYGVPFTVVRTISDRADAQAATDFMRFVNAVASAYASGVLRRYLAAFTDAASVASGAPVGRL
ncbi:5'-methylthioadenosine/adenosylhomocysteine nucleosidase [Schauerella aestuarii]|uniref:5'-methylthioadenosine/adenosylhomocysteine nucleosidase n=1 Tax=Schauerella aestuarii TaxID=2511204 RepID=UPI001F2E4EB8|nr:5'-methylthioadenosine/adenosylhomocysteine nucleosidase [Achromobacter aestuarii]